MQEHVGESESELSSTPFKRGKVKDIYELDSDKLLFVFTDRVSAYDIVLPSTIPRKGEVLCKLAAYWFNYLKVPHHMVSGEPEPDGCPEAEDDSGRVRCPRLSLR